MMFYCMTHIKHIHIFNLNTGIHYYTYDQHLKENYTETLTSYFEKAIYNSKKIIFICENK